MIKTVETQMEAFYWAYIDSRGTEGEEVRQNYQKLDQQLQDFSWKKQNDVQCAVNELCATVERTAFLDGLRSGAKLILELME